MCLLVPLIFFYNEGFGIKLPANIDTWRNRDSQLSIISYLLIILLVYIYLFIYLSNDVSIGQF